MPLGCLRLKREILLSTNTEASTSAHNSCHFRSARESRCRDLEVPDSGGRQDSGLLPWATDIARGDIIGCLSGRDKTDRPGSGTYRPRAIFAAS